MSNTLTRAVTFPSAGRPAPVLAGALTRLATPAGVSEAASELAPVAILLHPQPITSSMDDPLTERIATDLAGVGFVTLRFNFRGVGSSEGQQSDGRLEPLDVAGAVEFALREPGVNPAKLCLVGHAFGAWVALVYAGHDPRIKTVVAISPPLFRFSPEVGMFEKPKLFITGEFDEVAPRHKLEPLLDRLPARGFKVLSGARHLMRGYESVASQEVVHYLVRWANTPGV